MIDWLEIETTGIAYVSLAVCGALILAFLWKFTSSIRWPLLPLPRVRFISWQGIDVFIAFAISVMVPYLVGGLLDAADFFDWWYGAPRDKSMHERELLWIGAISILIEIGLMIFGLRLLRGTHFPELGLSFRRAGKNYMLGFLAFLVLTPSTFAVHFAATLVTPQEFLQEHHISSVSHQDLPVMEWLLLLTTAVVLAPIAEEILFRGILLPWQLEKGWEAQATIGFCVLLLATLSGIGSDNKPYNPAPVLFVLAMLPGIFLVPFLRQVPPSAFGLGPDEDASAPETSPKTNDTTNQEENPATARAQAAWHYAESDVAIYANGLLFATMHAGAWPSPIALFILGTGLAWLKYRTSSLIGPITLHALFNGVSAISLVLEHFWQTSQ